MDTKVGFGAGEDRKQAGKETEIRDLEKDAQRELRKGIWRMLRNWARGMAKRIWS